MNGVSQQVFSHFETTDITTTMNGMNTSLQAIKNIQDEIVKKAQERINLENQLADALVSGDSKEQASLLKKIDRTQYLENMQRDQLSMYQQQANALGMQVNYFDTVNNKVAEAENAQSQWVQWTIKNSTAAQDLAKNIGQSKDTLTQFFNIYQKAMSANGGSYQQMLNEDL